MATTILDVAQRANVSVATVSRVLHESNRVSEEMRTKVLDAIQELGYEITTRTVNIKQNKAILVLCGNIIDDLLGGIEDSAGELGYDVFFGYTMGQRISYTKFMKRLVGEKTICGLITLGICSDSIHDLMKINKQIPIVQCCDEIDLIDPCIVSSDDVLAAQEAVAHLINIGRKRIGFFGLERMLHPFKYSNRREIGYRRAHEKANIPIDNSLIKNGDFTIESSTEVAKEFLSMENRPDAIFCVRDMLANVLIKTLHKANIRIPEDIAVAGFGGKDSSKISWPPLTTIEQSYYEIGEEAANLLHARISGKVTNGRRLFIPHKLVVRNSTVNQSTEAEDAVLLT